MRQSKEDEYRELKRDAKAQGIEVNSRKYNPLTTTGVHSALQDQFGIIQSLGRKEYNAYGFIPGGETPDKPWQLATRIKASQLMHLAARCRRENRNESGWRYEIEQRLFDRFDIEVACKKCRRRLWRSEIEVDPQSSNSQTTSLKDRQHKRKACECNPNARIDEYSSLDPGLSDLFSFRTEEPCVAPDPSDASAKKRPDRIHGLQRTKNFEIILQSPFSHDDPRHQPLRLVEDVVHTTMNPDNGGSPLLFPFLISEAKREKGADNFEQMEIQTAFPIKHSLKLQYDLLQTPGNNMPVPGGPLVWFLANRGEDWRVYSGHVEEREGRPKYFINYLWGGSITGLNDSLQLILIIDHIVDWARDTFRPNILRQLRMLSTANYNDTATIAFDPDVYSLLDEVQPWMEGQDSDPIELFDVTIADTASEGSVREFNSNPLERFTTSTGVVKDAREIHSRLRGLIITRDNLDTVLQGFENPNAATRFAKSIVSLLSRRCVSLESEDVLYAVEEIWTGHKSLRPSRLTQQTKVYVQFRISYYINPVWEQIRELAYLAVAEDARELLIARAAIRGVTRRSQFSPPNCVKEDLIDAVDRLQMHSVRQDFVASLCRRTYTIDFGKPGNVITVDGDCNVSEVKKPKLIIKQDKDKKSPGVIMQGMVHAIYEKYRVGNREPSEPFLRASIRIDSGERRLWKGWKEGDSVCHTEQHLKRTLVHSKVPDARYLPDGSRQTYCLYIMDGRTDDLSDFAVTSKLLWAVYKEQIYGTVRKAKVLRNSRNWQDNRVEYCFPITSDQDPLKVGRERFRLDMFNWIKATTTPSLQASNPRTALRSWYMSKEAVMSLRRGEKLSTIWSGLPESGPD